MIAIYNPNSDPTLHRLLLPTDTEIAEFYDIAGFLQFLSDTREKIGKIILPLSISQGISMATPKNISTIKVLLLHHNHHRNIISGTYGTTFTGKIPRPAHGENIDTNQGGLLAKILVKDYATAIPNDTGELTGKFAKKVTLIVPHGYTTSDHQKRLKQYFRGLAIIIKNQKYSYFESVPKVPNVS